MATLIANDVQDGPLVTIAGLGAQPLVNQLLQSVEAGQPEGAQLSLTIQSLGQWAPAAAAYLNNRWANGQITDPASGEVLQAWPGAAQIATVDGQDTLTLQWVKGQPWAFILIGILIAGVIAFLFYQALGNAPWSMSNSSASSSGSHPAIPSGSGFSWFGGSPFRVFGLPWYDAALLGGGLVVVPWAIHEVTSGTQGLVAEKRAIRQLEGRG